MLVVPHAEYLRLGADAAARCVVYRELFKDALSADRLAEIRAYVQQQRVLGTPKFRREIEAMIGRCTSVRPAHRPRRRSELDKKGSDLVTRFSVRQSHASALLKTSKDTYYVDISTFHVWSKLGRFRS